MPVVLPSYFIRLYANADLVLAQADGRIVVKWRDKTDLTQLWNVVSVSAQEQTYNLLNVASLRGLSCRDYGDNLFLASEGLGDVWQLGGSGEFDAWNAIRLRNNVDWNLNVLGSGPYDTGRAVGVYKWDSDHANETWVITAADATPNPSGRYAQIASSFWVGSQRGGCFAVQDGDLDGTRPLILADYGLTPFAPARYVFEKIPWPGGFALRNKLNGKFIKWGFDPGSGHPRRLQQTGIMSLDCLWTAGSIGDPPRVAIRPFRDSSQNISIILDENPPGLQTVEWLHHGAQIWAIVEH